MHFYENNTVSHQVDFIPLTLNLLLTSSVSIDSLCKHSVELELRFLWFALRLCCFCCWNCIRLRESTGKLDLHHMKMSH
jgi:hypothetical protein